MILNNETREAHSQVQRLILAPAGGSVGSLMGALKKFVGTSAGTQTATSVYKDILILSRPGLNATIGKSNGLGDAIESGVSNSIQDNVNGQ